MDMDEEQEYITLNDAAQRVGVKKGSLYYYFKALGIKTHKFPLNKHAYIATKDVKRIQEAKISPWKVEVGHETGTISQ